MTPILVIVSCLLVTAMTKPTTNDQLDKVTVNDVAANAVSPDKKVDVAESVENKDGATVQITGITTGVDVPEEPAAPFQPPRAGSMFARFIDDIFQIPINVLQNVARLITSPFVQTKKTPEA